MQVEWWGGGGGLGQPQLSRSCLCSQGGQQPLSTQQQPPCLILCDYLVKTLDSLARYKHHLNKGTQQTVSVPCQRKNKSRLEVPGSKMWLPLATKPMIRKWKSELWFYQDKRVNMGGRKKQRGKQKGNKQKVMLLPFWEHKGSYLTHTVSKYRAPCFRWREQISSWTLLQLQIQPKSLTAQ